MNEQWLCCGGERGGFDIPVDRCLSWAAHLMATPPSEGYWTPPPPSSPPTTRMSLPTALELNGRDIRCRLCRASARVLAQGYINDLAAPWSSSKKKHLFVGVLFLYSSGAVEVVEGAGMGTRWMGGSGSRTVEMVWVMMEPFLGGVVGARARARAVVD